MRDLQLATTREVALVKTEDGLTKLVLGVSETQINLPNNVTRVLAHTHPGADGAFSAADILYMGLRGQKSSILIPELLPARILKVRQ